MRVEHLAARSPRGGHGGGHLALGALLCAVFGGCQTSPDAAGAGDPKAPATLPAWLNAPAALSRDARLEEAAALLCARDTDGVIDTDARHAVGISDGQVLGVLRTGADARAALVRDAAPLLEGARATVAGVVEGVTPEGAPCAALVAARRLVVVHGRLPGQLASGAPLPLQLTLPSDRHATLFVTQPSGFVDKLPLKAGSGTVNVATKRGDGRYVVEVIIDHPTRPDPEVALLWPFIAGVPKEPPFPEVLFPDEGHDDAALGHRAEALVQRLRNEQLIEPLKVSPPLVLLADERARGISAAGRLGHRVPGGADLVGTLNERHPDNPRARFVRLSEVQAQASTLADAWQALLDSPAHRYALVDTGITHMGVAVARGADAAGRSLVSMVALLARRAPSRDAAVVRGQLTDIINATREGRGLDPLAPSAHLDRLASRLADRMKDTGTVDDGALGAPVAQLALEADASLTRVRPLVSRLDDPLLLVQGRLPAAALELDAKQLGFGMALDATGVFYVCLLVGE